MGTKLKKILSTALILALTVNFLLYSSNSYAPPRADSISYSIVNCPEHEGEHHQKTIIQLFFASDTQHGAAKDCFCYDCCNQRISQDYVIQKLLVVLEHYSTKFVLSEESLLLEDSFKDLPIRSPPNLWA